MKNIILFLAFSLLLCVNIHAMDCLVISSTTARAQCSAITGDCYKQLWETSCFSKQTSAVIKQILSQIKVSDISEITAMKLDLDLPVREKVSITRFNIDPETMLETTKQDFIDCSLSHNLFIITVRVGRKNSFYNTSTFPEALQKDIYKMWLRFEAGNP